MVDCIRQLALMHERVTLVWRLPLAPLAPAHELTLCCRAVCWRCEPEMVAEMDANPTRRMDEFLEESNPGRAGRVPEESNRGKFGRIPDGGVVVGRE